MRLFFPEILYNLSSMLPSRLSLYTSHCCVALSWSKAGSTPGADALPCCSSCEKHTKHFGETSGKNSIYF